MSIPEPLQSPPEAPEAPTKKIIVTVRLAGSFETEIEVPEHLDITDLRAVEDAMEAGAPWGNFFHLCLSDLWMYSKVGEDPEPWYDKDKARVWLEGVEDK